MRSELELRHLIKTEQELIASLRPALLVVQQRHKERAECLGLIEKQISSAEVNISEASEELKSRFPCKSRVEGHGWRSVPCVKGQHRRCYSRLCDCDCRHAV